MCRTLVLTKTEHLQFFQLSYAEMWSIARRVLCLGSPLDLLSLLYAVYIYALGERNDVQLFGLCVAKYHGLRSSLCLLCAFFERCLALRYFLPSKLRSPMHPISAHIVYGLSFAVDGFIHGLVHLVLTHRPQDLPSLDRAVLWSRYRWTFSGVILIAFVSTFVASGRRLTLFKKLHAHVRNTHVTLYVLSLVVFIAHSSNYLVMGACMLVAIAEAVSSCMLAERVDIRKMELSDQDDSKTIEIQFCSKVFARRYRCGDSLRLYVPCIGLLETHALSVVPHHRRPQTFCLLVRVVGSWTERLSRLACNRRYVTCRIYVIGPFSNDGEVDIGALLSASREPLSSNADRPFCIIDPSWSLNLVCTGIAITRHLSLLHHLVHCYDRSAEKCCAIRQNAVLRLPGHIKLIWMVRKSFDINLVLLVLSDFQRSFEKYGWSHILTYDIFVSREPSSSERVVNTRVQKQLVMRGQLYSNIVTENAFRRYADSLHEELNAKANRRLTQEETLDHCRRLRNFYQQTNLRTGERVDDWRQLLAGPTDTGDECAHMLFDSDKLTAATTNTTILSTAIKSIARDLSCSLEADVDSALATPVQRLIVERPW